MAEKNIVGDQQQGGGGGRSGLLNRQNPLSVTKVICWQSLISVLSPKVYY